VTIQRGSGNFEIIADKSVLVTGNVHVSENIDQEFVNVPNIPVQNGFVNHNDDEHYILNTDDVYKELRLRGYNYKDQFKSILRVEDEGMRPIGQIFLSDTMD